MKKIIWIVIFLFLIVFSFILCVFYEKENSVEQCQITKNENVLISCLENSNLTIKEKMTMILNHKNFKFREVKNLIIYNRFLNITFSECSSTQQCKSEYKKEIDNFGIYILSLKEQCNVDKDKRCNEFM